MSAPRVWVGLLSWARSAVLRVVSIAERRWFLGAATGCAALFLAVWALSLPEYLVFLAGHPFRGRGAGEAWPPWLGLLGWTGTLSCVTAGLRMAAGKQWRWAAVVLVTSAVPAALAAYVVREWVLEVRKPSRAAG